MRNKNTTQLLTHKEAQYYSEGNDLLNPVTGEKQTWHYRLENMSRTACTEKQNCAKINTVIRRLHPLCISVLVLISTPPYIVHLLPHTECISLVTYQKFRQTISQRIKVKKWHTQSNDLTLALSFTNSRMSQQLRKKWAYFYIIPHQCDTINLIILKKKLDTSAKIRAQAHVETHMHSKDVMKI
jgi:hypothetical protein